MIELLKVPNCPGVAEEDDDDDAAAAAAVAVTEQQEVVVVEQESEEQVVEAQTAVVSVVEAGSQEVLHQVHFTMEVDGTTQEQQVSKHLHFSASTDRLSHAALPGHARASNLLPTLFLASLL